MNQRASGNHNVPLQKRSPKDFPHLLLASGPVVNSRDSEDTTSLHKAAQSGHLDVVRLVTLLLESGADIDTRYTNDAIPLGLMSQGI